MDGKYSLNPGWQIRWKNSIYGILGHLLYLFNHEGNQLDCGYRLDMLVENKIFLESKSIDKL